MVACARDRQGQLCEPLLWAMLGKHGAGSGDLGWVRGSMADAAQPDGPVTVVRTATSPTIDGHLTEAGWQRAAVIHPLTRAEPDEGSAPSERTRVYLLYDADTLYVGVRAYDTDPKRIVARERQRA
ncbi:MAG: hypothetical protein ACT4QB_14515 [Gammaproteobacteria bacterium]